MAGKGKPKTGGRQKGTPNKATLEVKQLAQMYGERAIAELAKIAFEATQEAARIAACKELLDRGYGKSMQYSEQKQVIENQDVNLVEMARRIAYLFEEGLNANVKH